MIMAGDSQNRPRAIQSSNPKISEPEEKPQKRKRKCTNKRKTGCFTCKKRRIKCDEHRPDCWNCLKHKDRVCEGYLEIKELSPRPNVPFQVRFQTEDDFVKTGSTTPNTDFRDSRSSSASSSASTTPTTGMISTRPVSTQHVGSPPVAEPPENEEPSYFLLQPSDGVESPYTGPGFGAPIITTPPGPTTTSSPSVKAESASPPGLGSINRNMSLAQITRRTFPLKYDITNTPFAADALSAKSFRFYMLHSGAAMGARSLPSFFLETIPQVATVYNYVRYAVLAVALVDESVNDHATNQGQQGPGIECRDVEARRQSFEMYGKAVRELRKSQTTVCGQYRSQRDSDDALAAALITCLLLFSFENWLWDVEKAGRHMDGALSLIRTYENSVVGQERRRGLLQDIVLRMMAQAVKYHNMSIRMRMPASKWGQGATWAPEAELVAA